MNMPFRASPNPRANVLGVGISAVDLPGAVNAIEEAARAGTPGYVCVTSVHGVMEAQRDPEFKRILSRAFLTTPDGMPTVWIGRLQGHTHMRRVFGPDLMTEICGRAPQNQFRHFLYGGNPGVADQLGSTLQQKHPALKIVGTFTPPFRPLNSSEERALQQALEQSRPDIVWVGLSTPKQERFMAEYIGRLPCKIMIGVGAAFDILTGRVKDAPSWVKNSGLQWVHRFCQEPRRLWKRYLVNNSAFLAALGLQLTGLRRYPLPPDHSKVASSSFSARPADVGGLTNGIQRTE